VKNQLVFCERCKAKLAEHRNGEYNIVWLVFDQRTGTYTDKEVPDEFSQGAFPFGRDCAKVVLVEHEASQPSPRDPQQVVRGGEVTRAEALH
jgi:hypothetical protein